ncbi:recombinase family protein [Rhodococcus daqingensis]|uniref:Recombinase family protein n=1 Tax=Rhodococcus daqingensis TaxID=2479363 RepID=A0ABW2RVQ2_9NOCA
MKTGIYVRISSDPTGKGLGVQRQEADCRDLADQLGWTVVEVYTDNDLSAFSGKARPGYERLLADLGSGRIEAVIAWHTDRLYRRMADLAPFIEVVRAARAQVRTVKAGELDLSTASGVMTAEILGSVAQHEVAHAQERMVAAHQQKAHSGRWTGTMRAFGYTQDGSAVIEVEAQAIRDAARDVLAGVSSAAIARRWNAAGLTTTQGRPWDFRRIAQILGNPTYAALATYKGVVVGPGNWEPILDGATHEALVGLLDSRRTPGRPRRWQGSGTYLCGRCGSVVRTYTVKGVSFYQCRAHQHLARKLTDVDGYVDTLVMGRLGAPDAHLVIERHDIDLPALQGKRDGLQLRLDQLAEMFRSGEIEASQLRVGTTGLRADIALVDAELAAAATRDPLSELVLSEGDIRERWSGMEVAERAAVIRVLMTVTIQPCPRGRRGFDPRYIEIDWKR